MIRYRLLFCLMAMILHGTMLFASNDGYTGRTLKTSNRGCGNCHGSNATSGVQVILTGPDTVYVNQSATFTLTISGGPASGSGCDIAVRYGSLSPVSSTLKLSGGELTHKTNTAMSGGSITYEFSYTYSGAQQYDTIYATGKSTNSNGGTSGDAWNWAPNKVIRIITATSVENEESLPQNTILYENYPNPFNPSTVISFELSRTEYVSLKVYNIQGQLVSTLIDGVETPGFKTINFDAGNIPAGIYIYRLSTPYSSHSKRMLYIK